MEEAFEWIANTAEPVFAVDRGQRIVLWNEAAGNLLGYRPDEIIGRCCFEVLRGVDECGARICRRDCACLTKFKSGKLAPCREVRFRRQDGQGVWVRVVTVALPAGDHELSILVHLFHELRRRHELESLASEIVALASRRLAVSAGSAHAAGGDAVPEGERLTPREREVLALLASGSSTGRIADELCISPATVRNHVHNILSKLDVHSRLEAVAAAIKNGYL